MASSVLIYKISCLMILFIEYPHTQILHNTEKYKQLDGVTPQDLAQLLRLDREITRLFEVQMRKRNKNDEMIRNKINDLNDKPSLRNFLFKKVSDQQMQKDIDALEKDVSKMFDIDQ